MYKTVKALLYQTGIIQVSYRYHTGIQLSYRYTGIRPSENHLGLPTKEG